MACQSEEDAEGEPEYEYHDAGGRPKGKAMHEYDIGNGKGNDVHVIENTILIHNFMTIVPFLPKILRFTTMATVTPKQRTVNITTRTTESPSTTKTAREKRRETKTRAKRRRTPCWYR